MADIFIDTNASGANDGTSKTDAYNNSATAVQDALTAWVSGDIIYIEKTSSITQATNYSFTCASTSNELAVIRRIDFTDDSYEGVPATANITTTGAADISPAVNARWQGVYFSTDDDLNANSSPRLQIFEDCYFAVDDLFEAMGGNADGMNQLKNCTIEFKGGASRINAGGAGLFRMQGGVITGTLSTGGLLAANANKFNHWIIESVDMSGLPASRALVGTSGDSGDIADFIRCDLPASYTRFATAPSFEQQIVRIWMSDDAGNDYIAEREDMRGVYDTNTAIYLTAGYNFQGDQQLSRVLTPSANVGTSATIGYGVLESEPVLFKFDGTLNTATTFELEFLENYTVALTKKNAWVEFYYLATAGETNWTLISTQDLDGLGAGTALSAGVGTGSWTGTTTGYTSHKFALTTDGSAIPHPQKTGMFKGVVKLAVYESGKDLIMNPQVVVS